MQNKYVPPSVRETAFNCPHCGTLTTQYWYDAWARPCRKEYPLPSILNPEEYKEMDFGNVEDDSLKSFLVSFYKKMSEGTPVFGREEISVYAWEVGNINISKCYNCSHLSVWLFDSLVYPPNGDAPPPNPDLPIDVRRDYDEASAILSVSPRGAAALIRLAIQKLCKALGRPGKNINEDIKSLVADGLDPRTQKALDYVRVIGNNAVHPGQIDIKDDRAAAETLFMLLNLIAEKLISQPKHVDEVYASLPKEARDQIARRDKKE